VLLLQQCSENIDAHQPSVGRRPILLLLLLLAVQPASRR